MPTSDTALQRKMCEAPALKFFTDDTSPNGSVSGYLSTFGNIDRGGEIVMKGAFTGTVDQFVKNGFFALNHNWDVLPIGTITSAHEDDAGLHFSADFHSYPAAQEARTVAMERLARGKSVSTSIGYKPVDKERTKDALLLKSIDLYEGSMVNVPMNPLPTIGAVKGLSVAEMFDAALDLPDGSTFADQLEAVRAAVEASLTRAKAIQEMRAKEGRVLSSANVSRMRDMAGSLQDHANTLAAMCDQATPKALPSAVDAARVELARFLREQSRMLGVAV